jgi:hypothetical protein
MPEFPSVRVGEPLCYGALNVWPLFTESEEAAVYLLSDEAMASQSLAVEEVSEAGSVPTLVVHNQGEMLVLFLEGEELHGAKQNRVLNTSVLVAGKQKTLIPVSCVEQGRWRFQSRQFGSAGRHSSSKLRYILKESVTRSSREGRGLRSDQGAVWKEVGRQMKSLGVESETAAMADTYQRYDARLKEFRERLQYADGACGLAVALGSQVVSVDLFDKPATCRKVWDRLLSGLILDALESDPSDRPAERASVEAQLQGLRDAAWQPAEAVGAGDEFRAELDGRRQASALCLNGAVVHGSLVAAC